jgi:hypothetical protein
VKKNDMQRANCVTPRDKKEKRESKMFTDETVKIILETKFQGNCINKSSSHG